MYVSTLLSQFVPPFLPPTVSTSLLSMSVSLPLPADRFTSSISQVYYGVQAVGYVGIWGKDSSSAFPKSCQKCMALTEYGENEGKTTL